MGVAGAGVAGVDAEGVGVAGVDVAGVGIAGVDVAERRRRTHRSTTWTNPSEHRRGRTHRNTWACPVGSLDLELVLQLGSGSPLELILQPGSGSPVAPGWIARIVPVSPTRWRCPVIHSLIISVDTPVQVRLESMMCTT